MYLSIPIFVQAGKPRGGGPLVYHCRPLFFPCAGGSDENLFRAMGKTMRQVRQMLDALASQSRHDDLANCGFAPDLKEHLLSLTLQVRDRHLPCRLLVVEVSCFGRRIAFTPVLPEIWFEIQPGEQIHERAEEVYTAYFKARAKEDPNIAQSVDRISHTGKAWIATLDLDVQVRQPTLEEQEKKWAALWDDSKMDGATELHRIGRCLDWLYPDDLDRAILRDREVEELDRLLESADRRPVLLVGPRQAGKTTVLHECVHRRVGRRRRQYAAKHNVWLLSPQRLISGMMFVGQWENRLLAILDVAQRKNHVIYFDDFLGLYHAGKSRDSKLCAADVLRNAIQKRHVRVLAEMTREAFHAFQEKDRGLADQFHVVRVEEAAGADNLRICVAAIRQLESQYRCRFNIDVLPTVLEIQQRYVRQAALPGKAVGFLRQLAVKFKNQQIVRDMVFAEFHARTGVTLSLLDHRQRLPREEILEALRRQIIGQRPALEAAADVISIAKARLNDTGRPLASFLFLGPTGVGKTQCAKALAGYLFSDAEKVLRFDMNEFVSPAAVARLVGTFDQPEGLLTAAVRRQPFSVVLLDEIEKAHPDVFDLLLQATGEARLTDALGRTTDFSNAILIMTSNLGSRKAATSLGFGGDDQSGQHAYVKAAERFFRPEFFNRLDRIIPFERLRREDVRQIAGLQMREVFQREGLVRRRSVLGVYRAAMEKVVDEGYHPQLGARALKRSLEKQLIQPVAARLAVLRPEAPTVVTVYPRSDGIAVHVQELVDAAATGHAGLVGEQPEDFLAAARQAVRRIEQQCQQRRPPAELVAGRISADQEQYFLLREQLRRVQQQADELNERWSAGRRNPFPALATPVRSRTDIRKGHKYGGERAFMKEIFSTQDIHAWVRETAAAAQLRWKDQDAQLLDLQRQLALLEAMAQADVGYDQTLLVLETLPDAPEEFLETARQRYQDACSESLHLSTGTIPDDQIPPVLDTPLEAVVVSGWHAWPLLRQEAGAHLCIGDREAIVPVFVHVFPIAVESSPQQALDEFVHRRRSWLDALYSGDADVEQNPEPIGPVVRIHEQETTIDIRTRLVGSSDNASPGLQEFLLAALSLPSELEGHA